MVRPISGQKIGPGFGPSMTDPPDSSRQSTRNISVGGKILNVKTQDMFLPAVDSTRY